MSSKTTKEELAKRLSEHKEEVDEINAMDPAHLQIMPRLFNEDDIDYDIDKK